jgi:hypothetical protein
MVSAPSVVLRKVAQDQESFPNPDAVALICQRIALLLAQTRGAFDEVYLLIFIAVFKLIIIGVVLFSAPCFIAAFMQLLLPRQSESRDLNVLADLASDPANSATF